MIIEAFKNDDFKISFEPNKSGNLFTHCEVYRYTPSVRKSIEAEFVEAQRALKRDGHHVIFAACTKGDEKKMKFFRMFGFKHVDTVGRQELFMQRILLWAT